LEDGMSKQALAIPPGTYVQEELEERGWTQLDLADVLGRPIRLVNEIISGKRAITPETAQGLAAAFGTSAQLWMNLESAYRLCLAAAGNESVSRRAQLFTRAPVRDMQRRGWIKEKTETVEELEEELKRFYGTQSMDEPLVLSVATRRRATSDGLTASQTAWCVRARQLATAQVVAPFDASRFDKFFGELRKLAAYPKDARKLPDVCAQYGIRFVIVEPLPGAKIDGAAFWLDENSPAIAVSMRYDRIDAFWFTVLHECSHIHHSDALSVDIEIVGTMDRASTEDETEQRANAEASAALIPADELESFIRRVGPLYSKQRINQFANVMRIHPGVIVGQLQYRGEIGYNSHREMLVKVRDAVISTALTDGWGKTLSPDAL